MVPPLYAKCGFQVFKSKQRPTRTSGCESESIDEEKVLLIPQHGCSGYNYMVTDQWNSPQLAVVKFQPLKFDI